MKRAKLWTAQLITAHFVAHFRASLTTATTMSLMGVAFPINSLLHWIAPSHEHLLSAVLKRHRSREGPSHCGGVLVGCQGERLSVTSACDIGALCHVGLFLLHAVMAKGWRPSSSLPTLSSRLTHAPGSFVPFRRSARSTTVEIRRVFYTPPGVGCQNGHDTANWTICSGIGRHLLSHGCKPFGFHSHFVNICKMGLLRV